MTTAQTNGGRHRTSRSERARIAHWFVILMTAIWAIPAGAEVIIFDNTDQRFLWHSLVGGYGPKYTAYLGLMLPPAQPPDDKPDSVYYCPPDNHGPSDSPMTSGIRCRLSAQVAREEGYWVPSDWDLWVAPITVFEPGDVVGPNQIWGGDATTSYWTADTDGESFLGSDSYIGVRVEVAGQYYYGWIQLQKSWGVQSLNPYTPTRWAYETDPDTPIEVTAPPAALFVDDDAQPGGNGLSWDTAFRYLHDALAVVEQSGIIRVAQGTYRPDESAAHPDGTGDRAASFNLPRGVVIEGGYAGLGAPDPDARVPALYETILSGDLSGDDGPGFANYEDNSRHVVTADDAVHGGTRLDGVTIRGGYSDEDSGDPLVAGGSGLFCDGGSPAVVNCRFEANHTGRAGGALYSRTGAAFIDRCTFVDNAGGYGAALNTRSGTPVIRNCIIERNTSGYGGGGIANEANLSLANCLLRGNSAATTGGAINTAGTLIVTNCTVTQNQAASAGGGILATSNALGIEIGNSILWGNVDTGGSDESAQFHLGGGVATVNHSCLQGWSGMFGGAGNFGDDPQFRKELGPDGLPGTGDEDHHLRDTSPCIDTGSSDHIAYYIEDDLDGADRLVSSIDVGAYEYQGSSTLYVDSAAPPGGGGRTWETAFRHLQDALIMALEGDEIRVAQGTHRPDETSTFPHGSGDRAAHFALPDDVTLLGGYGGREAYGDGYWWDERDPARYETILSGDLNEDDGSDFSNYGDNARHILTADASVGDTTLIDGFTIRGGYSVEDSADPAIAGGSGLFCDGGSPHVMSCRFEANHTGRAGGALYTRSGAPRIERCSFTSNRGGYGAALNTRSGNPTVVNCVFLDNETDYSGGAIANEAELLLVSCALGRNHAAMRGGAISMAGILDAINCTFAQNSAVLTGGGIIAGSGTERLSIVNSILWANEDGSGSGEAAQILHIDGQLAVDHCCVQGWSGSYGGVGNSGDRPYFKTLYGRDGLWATGDENYHLSLDSPYRDVGDNSAVPAFVLTDPDGMPRIHDDVDIGADGPVVVDLGAYERQSGDLRLFDGVLDDYDYIATDAGDLNNDGLVDLATTQQSRLSILINNGDFGFGPARRVQVGWRPFTVQIADLNGDGRNDIAVLNYGSEDISIVINMADGTFVEAGRYPAGDVYDDLIACDVDNDGDVDLLTIDHDLAMLSVLLNDGDGAFTDQYAHPAGGHPRSMAVGDVDGDGDMDCVVGNHLHYFTVLMNDGTGMFGTPVAYDTTHTADLLVLDDINGDAMLDVVCAPGGSDSDGTLTLFRGHGDGTFSQHDSYAFIDNVYWLSSADVDADEDVDLVVGSRGEFSHSILINDGTGTLVERLDYCADGVMSRTVAEDIDGDGDDDIAGLYETDDSVFTGVLFLGLQRPDCIGDLDDDGVVDLADLGILLASFGLEPDDPWYDPRADVDGDGDVDLSDLGALLAAYELPCP
jgi:hypothetical protein